MEAVTPVVYWIILVTEGDVIFRALNFRILDHLCHLYITPVFPTPNRPPLISPENRGKRIQPVAGWPPALRGKKWFTFHERPLQPSTRAALETLQRNGSFSTLHAAVAYLQLEEWRIGWVYQPKWHPSK